MRERQVHNESKHNKGKPEQGDTTEKSKLSS